MSKRADKGLATVPLKKRDSKLTNELHTIVKARDNHIVDVFAKALRS